MPTHPENEVELVSEAREGCGSCFGILVNWYEQHIYRLSLAVVKNPEDAEDVLQETFLKAYANLDQFRGESRFYTWLVRIAMNEALSKLRRGQAATWISLEGPGDFEEPGASAIDAQDWRDNPEEAYSKSELRTLLADALSGLNTSLRVVFALRDIEGLSSEETAKVLGLSVGTVKSRLMRARLSLRKKLSVWFERRRAAAAG
jgi:RNA polymerase sigma-70 factor (ECF subfamily)